MQASTSKECKKLAQFALSRPIITIVIWTITAGTKASRSRYKASWAKYVKSCYLWAAHDPCHDREQAPPARELRCSFFVNSLGCSRSDVTTVSKHPEPVTKLHSSSLKSGVLTISRHDREHAPRARDHQVSSGLHFFKKSGALMILCHDREQAIPARDFQLVNF